MGSSSGAALGGNGFYSDRRRSLPSPSRLGVPRMWLFGGGVTSSKVLGEHRGGEKRRTAQCFCAGVGKIVTDIGRQHEHTAGADRECPYIPSQLASAGNDVLGFFGLVGMPAELVPGFDLEDDGGRGDRLLVSVGDERPVPFHLGASLPEICRRARCSWQ